MKRLRDPRLVVLAAIVTVMLSACGGNSAEEELLEQIIESGGEDVGDVDINTDGDGNVNISVEGEDGETINITGEGGDDGDVNMVIEGDDGEQVTVSGSGDDDEFTITVEGEDGGTISIGGGDIPDELTLPVHEGGSVITSMTSGEGVSVTLMYPRAAYDELVAFYTDRLPTGDDVYKNEMSYTDDDGTHRGTSWIGDEFMVSIDDCFGMESDELDSACVSLHQFG